MAFNIKGKIFRVIVMILLAADIVLAWYSYHEMREDIGDVEERNSTDVERLCTEDKIHNFWKVYVGFESFSTLFKYIQFIQVLVELCKGEKHPIGYPLILVLISYTAEIGSGLSTVLFMQFCACSDLSPSTWTIGKADLIQKLVSGAGLVGVQFLIHATSLLNKSRTIKDFVDGMFKSEDKKPGNCIFITNIFFFILYFILFCAEIYFAFCG